MSINNSSDTILNPTRDLPACSVVSQPTAPPLVPLIAGEEYKLFKFLNMYFFSLSDYAFFSAHSSEAASISVFVLVYKTKSLIHVKEQVEL